MRRRPNPVVIGLAGLALAAAACGGSSAGSADGSGTAPPTTSTASAPIVLDRPRDGAIVGAPIRFAGTATVFEGTVDVELRDGTGHTLAATFVTATCGTGCRGTYTGSISPPAGYLGPVRLRLFERSAQDGSELHPVEIDLTVAR